MPGSRPTERLLRGRAPDVEADDGADPSPVALKARALAIEEAARAVPGDHQFSEGAGVERRADGGRARHQPRLLPRLFDQRLWRGRRA